MASVEKKVERSDSLPRRIFRGIVHFIVPILAVSAALYCIGALNDARNGQTVRAEFLQAKTYYEEGGDGFVYLGMSDARINARNTALSGAYAIKEGTITVANGEKSLSFRIITSSRILSLEWGALFSEKAAS